MLPVIGRVLGVVLKHELGENTKKGLTREVSKLATKSATAAASAKRKELRSDLKKEGLSSKEITKELKKPEYKNQIADSRNKARNQWTDLLADLPEGKTRIPAGLVNKVSNQLKNGSIEGAAKEVARYGARAITREKSDLKRGTAKRIALEIDNFKTTPLMVAETLEEFLNGKTVREAARVTITKDYAQMQIGNQIVGRKTVFGRTALDIAETAGKANAMRNKIKNLTKLPQPTINRIMDAVFDRTSKEGVWKDKDGREWTAEEVEALTTSDGMAVRDIKPENFQDDTSIENEASKLPLNSIATTTSTLAANFLKSLDSAGVKEDAPRIYSDIKAVIANMSPTKLAWIVGQSPTRRGVKIYKGRAHAFKQTIYLSSDRSLTQANLTRFLTDIGLDPKKYTEGELTLTPELKEGVVLNG